MCSFTHSGQKQSEIDLRPFDRSALSSTTQTQLISDSSQKFKVSLIDWVVIDFCVPREEGNLFGQTLMGLLQPWTEAEGDFPCGVSHSRVWGASHPRPHLLSPYLRSLTLLLPLMGCASSGWELFTHLCYQTNQGTKPCKSEEYLMEIGCI